MKTTHDYGEPPAEIIDWARMMVSVTKHNAMWVIPASGHVYRFDHEKHVMELQNPDVLRDADAAQWHFMNAIVFERVGYTVTEKGALAA